LGWGDGVGAGWDVFVGVGEWCECASEVPGDVGGQQADEYVGADSFGQVVEDWS
jgi:hypothetical protein